MNDIKLDTDFKNSIYNVSLDLSKNDGIGLMLYTQIHTDSTVRFAIPEFDIDYGTQHWSGGSEKMQLEIRDKQFRFQDFKLISKSKTEQEEVVEIDV